MSLGLNWPSVASRILQRKLLFLQQVMSTEECVSHQGFCESSTIPLQLIDRCLFLESHLGLSGLMDRAREASISTGELKKEIMKKDKETLITSSLEHLSTSTASRIAKRVQLVEAVGFGYGLGTHRYNSFAALVQRNHKAFLGLSILFIILRMFTT